MTSQGAHADCRAKSSIARKAVEIISQGNEPRRQLRYSPCQSCSEHMTLLLSARFETRYLLDARPDQVSEGSPLSVVLTATSVPPRTPGNTAYRLAFSGPLEATKGAAEADVLGRIASAGLDTQSVSLLNFKEELNALIVPFPDEPVGVGASWRVATQRVTENGTLQPESRTYELAAMDGDVLFVRATAREIFDPHACRNGKPAARPAAAEAGKVVTQEVLWSHGTRTSEVCLNLRRILPEKRSELRRLFEERIVSDGIEQRLDSVVSATLELRPEAGTTAHCSALGFRGNTPAASHTTAPQTAPPQR